ncbi:MAG: AarF/ABC1/UbiB kinase family protein [Planctomycetaceae bacterium]|nr:AarF/ABC1/UbiB kinase family protein [Planctomycetaceae bacterium]
MSMPGLVPMIRNVGRFREIVNTLMKYGLADWLKSVPGDWVKQYLSTVDGEKIADLSYPVRVRLALTELGTTFIKLGQILSTRQDLVGPDFCEELTKLQSQAPADDYETVCRIIEEELGEPPDQLFGRFEREPLGSASIGQVHRAILVDGSEVVVKVRHEGIEQRIQHDLEIMDILAQLAEKHSSLLRHYRPVETAADFRRILLDELNYSSELRNMIRFRGNFEEREEVRFPKPYKEYSTARVLTMEEFRGTSVADAQSVADQYDLTEIARQGANVYLDMVYRDGFFHADPHPGNLMILPDGTIGILDCGMVGKIDEELRDQVEDMLMAIVEKDGRWLTSIVVDLGQVPTDLDRDLLQRDIVDFVEEYVGLELDDFDLTGALEDLMRIIRMHHILLPPRVSLMVKVMVMLEGTGRLLQTDFSLLALIAPYRYEILRRRLSPYRLWRNSKRAYREWSQLFEILPRDTRELLRSMKRGKFEVHLDHRRLDKIVNRMAWGILTAALFVGSSQILSMKVLPTLWGVSVPGFLGCSYSLYLAWRLFRAIRKSGDLG